MDKGSIVITIINIIAVLVAPIVAVIITQKMQDRASKRKDKIEIFKTLVSNKAYGWGSNYLAVNALNSIPVIFAANKEIVQAYFAYFDACKIKNETSNDSELKEIDTCSIKILELMAKELNYNSEWNVFTKSYLPKGIVEDLNRKKRVEDIQLSVGDYIIFLKNSNALQSQNKENNNG